ncbi:ninjurin-A-like [Culicoides brevitarsis]|uniref:ninjurin-A-like n=1 Tax=Culicoides brevitarsis TaxID=469753 RepID=UPI00307B234F
MTDYTAINISAPLAPEDDIDEIDGGVRQALQNRNNKNRKPSPSRIKSSNEEMQLVNKRGSRPELEKLEFEEFDIGSDNRPKKHSDEGIDDGLLEKENGPPSPPHPDYIPYPSGMFPASPFDPHTIHPDVNMYQHKKTLAQGLMDLALVSANANQLRYVLESSNRHPYYYFSLGLIITSLIIQVIVGIGLIWNSRYNVKDEKEMHHANRINNITMILIFLLTFVNVFITAFGVAEYQQEKPIV